MPVSNIPPAKNWHGIWPGHFGFLKTSGHCPRQPRMRATTSYTLSVLLFAAPTLGTSNEKRGKKPTPLVYAKLPQQELMYPQKHGGYPQASASSQMSHRGIYKEGRFPGDVNRPLVPCKDHQTPWNTAATVGSSLPHPESDKRELSVTKSVYYLGHAH